MLKCPDCLAHYSEGYDHICPPWLKALVKLKKDEHQREQENSQGS